MDPPPLRKFRFCRTPPGNIIIPCGNQKYDIFLVQDTEFGSLPFFFEKNLVDTVTDTSPEGTSQNLRYANYRFNTVNSAP